MLQFPEKIYLHNLGHAYSSFKRELIYKDIKGDIARYVATEVSRIIGNLDDIQAIDFDGGPFLGVGDSLFNSFVITGFVRDKKTKEILVLLTKCSI